VPRALVCGSRSVLMPLSGTFDEAHTVLLWACEHRNYTSNEMILRRAFHRIFRPDAPESANASDLFREPAVSSGGCAVTGALCTTT